MIELLTPTELQEYLAQLYNRLLEHRYRYYVLADPVLSDWEYDYIERYYNALAAQYGAKEMDMVDWDIDAPGAPQAAYRVDTKQDNYSLWEAEMIPVWERLGKPEAVTYKKQENVVTQE